MATKRGYVNAGLLSDGSELDPRHGSVSPVGGVKKNGVRDIELRELQSAMSNTSTDDMVSETNLDNLSNDMTGGNNGNPASKGSTDIDSLLNALPGETYQPDDQFKTMAPPPSNPFVDNDYTSRSQSEVDIPLPPSSRQSLDNNNLDLYCVDHMRLLTNKEAEEEHKDCEFVVPAHEWAEAQTMERDRRNIEAQLKRFDMFAERMIDERGDFKRHLAEEKEEVTEQFLDVMEDLVAFLLTKQKMFLHQLCELHDKHIQDINEQVKRCTNVQKETNSCLQKLENCEPGSDEFKVLKSKIQDKCPVYEEILRRDFNNATRLDYEMRRDPWVESIFENLKSIGDVTARPRPSKLPGFLSESNETDYAKKDLEMVVHHEAISSKDDNKCCFSGAVYVTGGRMILADWNNTCIKLFNSNGVLTKLLQLPNNPWDLKPLPGSRVVVTVPGSQTIYIITYKGDSSLEIESSFETDSECWGVVPVQDKLAMTCEPWSKTPSVKIYTLTGKLLSFYQKDDKGATLFAYPEHIATDIHQQILYVSDNRKNMLIALTLEGLVLFRYYHKLLTGATGVTTDNQGYIYVCGKDSQNIHQLTKTGELVRIIMDSRTLQAPRAVYFDAELQSLIITDVGADNCEDVLTVKWK